ncbi:hypothetical protein Q1W73_01505 [Asticcacaulis sp. ZE23SCel15]|uniref:hypothetical protein n=1 Tax=Asticcacaulis sp. ZE23SCel15 TaxID=3059027 RepID=UPI00265F1310|nr:hypothetical protein [Asticcacaulis sp. ZE23SCel15]WKL57686.1 hypothetical protein Q1W73_01505 [Asticcacaulis sp. ZE23SCel15]
MPQSSRRPASTRYRFRVRLDPKRRLVIVRITGNMKSTNLVDQIFSAARKLDRPWAWRRLIDLRDFSGFIEFEDIEHLAKRWQFLTRDVIHKGRTAIVSKSALDLARVSTITPLFPNEIFRGFESFDEAVDWLEASSL